MKKALFFIAAGYVAGTIVASMYSKNTGKTTKKDFMESDSKFKSIVSTFIDVHRGLFEDVKDEITKDENMEIYNEYKDKLAEVFQNYKEKGQDLLLDLKEKGQDYLDVTAKKLKALYNEKIKEVDDMKDLGKEKAEQAKKKLEKISKETEKEMKKIKK